MAFTHNIPMLILLLIGSFITVQFAASQTIGTLQPGFGQALAEVHRAEMSGSTSADTSSLVSLLNKALELNNEALQPTTPASKRAALLAEVDQILASVQDRAAELTNTYSEKSYADEILAYAVGAAVAFVGTVLWGFAGTFYQTYRVEKIFQMRVKRK